MGSTGLFRITEEIASESNPVNPANRVYEIDCHSLHQLGLHCGSPGADAVSCSCRCATGCNDSFSRSITGNYADFIRHYCAGATVDASNIDRHSLQKFQGAVDWAGGDGRSGERHRD